jgi:hypothetical protein
MNDQGARRNRPAAHARGAPWPSADDPPGPGTATGPLSSPGTATGPLSSPGTATGPLSSPGTATGPLPGPGTATGPLLGPGTGGYRVLEGGTVPQRVLGPGSGPQRVLAPGTGPQPTLERTPVRGFPPLAPGQPPAPTPPEGFSSGRGPGAQPAGPAAGYAEDSADQDDPVAPASITAGPGRRGERAPGGPSRRPSRMAWLVTAAVVIVAVGGYASYKYLYEPRVNAPVPSTLRLPTNSPGSPGFDPALGKWQHIGTRSQDPEPLTLDELFPPQFELNGSSYVRTAAALTKDCSLPVFGSNLQAALQAGHCTQVLRASYISGNGTMMGTVGVANLSSSSAAQKAGQTTGPQEIIAPLAAQNGPTSKLGNGTGVVQAEIKGHYLILMWAEFTSLKSPATAAQRQQLEQFATDLVTGSANINLSTRMLTGKP